MPIAKTTPVYSLKLWGNRSIRNIKFSPDQRLAAFTHRAGRLKNQDGLLVHFGQRKVMAVVDGMGGMPAGAEASRIALETMAEGIEQNIPLDIIFGKAHQRLLQTGFEDKAKRGLGTTLAAVEIESNQAFVSSVGDSRVYLIRQGQEPALLTVDQNTAGESYEFHHAAVMHLPMRQTGEYYAYVRNFPCNEKHNHGFTGNELYSALGLTDMDIVNSDVRLAPGDRLLLATDGLNYLPYNIFASIMGKMRPLEKTVHRLLQGTYKLMNTIMDAGYLGDNIALILYEHQPEN
jgi:serine/threonine protein phosphatase PrpC